MKPIHRLSLLSLLLLILAWFTPVQAQDVNPTGTETAPPGSTVITSDELHSDQLNHTAVFTGNVTVVGTNFNLACQEMTVNFTKDGKIDNILATGDVVITQPGRVTHSGQAQYFRLEDKFVLTDQPKIVDNKNEISAPKITIYRLKQTMITEGGRSTVIMKNDGMASPTTPTSNP